MTESNPGALAALRRTVTERFAVPSTPRAVYQLVNTLAVYVGCWMAALWSLDVSYLLTLLFIVPLAGASVRLFIFQHDCGHGSFLPSQRWNDIVGSVLGVVTVTPYHYWRRTHASHHATSGNLDRRGMGDIDTLTVEEYKALAPAKRLAYRLYRNPVVLLGFGAFFHFVVFHRWPTNMPPSWKTERRGVLFTNLGLALLVGVLCWAVGWERFLLVQVPTTAVSCAFGVWLFYVQHQFEDAYWRPATSWSFEEAGLDGSSYYRMPRVMQWFTGNIGIHHVHHLSSRIPNYRLEKAMRETPELQRPVELSLLSSLRCASLKLWDERTGRLVRFKDVA